MIRVRKKREPVLWIIDNQQWPRACLRAELIERGYDAFGFVKLSDALDDLAAQRSPLPEAVVLDLQDQDLTPELLRNLHDLNAVTILIGGAVELQDPIVQQQHWSAILKRPVSLGTIADLVQQSIPLSPKPC